MRHSPKRSNQCCNNYSLCFIVTHYVFGKILQNWKKIFFYHLCVHFFLLSVTVKTPSFYKRWRQFNTKEIMLCAFVLSYIFVFFCHNQNYSVTTVTSCCLVKAVQIGYCSIKTGLWCKYFNRLIITKSFDWIFFIVLFIKIIFPTKRMPGITLNIK